MNLGTGSSLRDGMVQGGPIECPLDYDDELGVLLTYGFVDEVINCTNGIAANPEQLLKNPGVLIMRLAALHNQSRYHSRFDAGLVSLHTKWRDKLLLTIHQLWRWGSKWICSSQLVLGSLLQSTFSSSWHRVWCANGGWLLVRVWFCEQSQLHKVASVIHCVTHSIEQNWAIVAAARRDELEIVLPKTWQAALLMDEEAFAAWWERMQPNWCWMRVPIVVTETNSPTVGCSFLFSDAWSYVLRLWLACLCL